MTQVAEKTQKSHPESAQIKDAAFKWDDPLDLDHYDSVRQSSSALDRHATEIYDGLPEAARRTNLLSEWSVRSVSPGPERDPSGWVRCITLA